VILAVSLVRLALAAALAPAATPPTTMIRGPSLNLVASIDTCCFRSLLVTAKEIPGTL
jgi:hypothetical protein